MVPHFKKSRPEGYRWWRILLSELQILDSVLDAQPRQRVKALFERGESSDRCWRADHGIHEGTQPDGNGDCPGIGITEHAILKVTGPA